MTTDTHSGWGMFGRSTARFDRRWVGRVALCWNGGVYVEKARLLGAWAIENLSAEEWMMEGEFGPAWNEFIGAGDDDTEMIRRSNPKLAGLSPDELLSLGFRAVVTLDGIEEEPSVLFQGDGVRRSSIGDAWVSVEDMSDGRLELLFIERDDDGAPVHSAIGIRSNAQARPARCFLTLWRDGETTFLKDEHGLIGKPAMQRSLTPEDLLAYVPFTPDAYWPLGLVVAKYAEELLGGLATPALLAAGPVPNGRCGEYITQCVQPYEWWTGFNGGGGGAPALSSVEDCLRVPRSINDALNLYAYTFKGRPWETAGSMSCAYLTEHVSPGCRGDIRWRTVERIERFVQSAFLSETATEQICSIFREAEYRKREKENDWENEKIEIVGRIAAAYAVNESELNVPVESFF